MYLYNKIVIHQRLHVHGSYIRKMYMEDLLDVIGGIKQCNKTQNNDFYLFRKRIKIERSRT